MSEACSLGLFPSCRISPAARASSRTWTPSPGSWPPSWHLTTPTQPWCVTLPYTIAVFCHTVCQGQSEETTEVAMRHWSWLFASCVESKAQSVAFFIWSAAGGGAAGGAERAAAAAVQLPAAGCGRARWRDGADPVAAARHAGAGAPFTGVLHLLSAAATRQGQSSVTCMSCMQCRPRHNIQGRQLIINTSFLM